RNRGSDRSRIIAAMMTLLNRKFGLWVPNPRETASPGWAKRTPAFAIALWNELVGANTVDSRWLDISDGGHFDNLGLFEMVLRRCRLILVVDATPDPDRTCADLLEAMRKINLELNIPIDFLSPLPIGTEDSGRHCALARVVYGAAD